VRAESDATPMTMSSMGIAAKNILKATACACATQLGITRRVAAYKRFQKESMSAARLYTTPGAQLKGLRMDGVPQIEIRRIDRFRFCLETPTWFPSLGRREHSIPSRPSALPEPAA
jgi:hypothetical protein